MAYQAILLSLRGKITKTIKSDELESLQYVWEELSMTVTVVFPGFGYNVVDHDTIQHQP
ncbi:MAG: hypothetical protein QXY55_05350 [Candidatus Korarchaeota archaeon]